MRNKDDLVLAQRRASANAAKMQTLTKGDRKIRMFKYTEDAFPFWSVGLKIPPRLKCAGYHTLVSALRTIY